MGPLSLDQIALAVARQFPILLPPISLQFFGNHGGFSGAKLWHVAALEGNYCLRGWPADKATPKQLNIIHAFMRRAWDDGLTVIPKVFPTSRGASFVEEFGRLWEVTSWMPGRADFKESPTGVKLRRAAQVLANLHCCWQDFPPDTGPCPAVHRRLSCLRSWLQKTHSGWQPKAHDSGSTRIMPLAQRACRLLAGWTPRLEPLLNPWIEPAFPLQMCLCDIWHDHLLFEAEQVTGLLDFGSIKRDHVAVDLSRMLGSLIGDDRDQRQTALDAYREIRPLEEVELALIHVLDRSGTILAMANWLTWLYWDRRQFENYTAVETRLSALVRRVETWDN
jgi:Ser/Thr protein kinase RdoA (MazF antagonist)